VEISGRFLFLAVPSRLQDPSRWHLHWAKCQSKRRRNCSYRKKDSRFCRRRSPEGPARLPSRTAVQIVQLNWVSWGRQGCCSWFLLLRTCLFSYLRGIRQSLESSHSEESLRIRYLFKETGLFSRSEDYY